MKMWFKPALAWGLTALSNGIRYSGAIDQVHDALKVALTVVGLVAGVFAVIISVHTLRIRKLEEELVKNQACSECSKNPKLFNPDLCSFKRGHKPPWCPHPEPGGTVKSDPEQKEANETND